MTEGTAAAAGGRGRRPPLLLVTLAAAVCLAAAMPLAYLVLRALAADADARALVPGSIALELVVNTTLLVIGVVAASVAAGAPLAWLVVRTDLPGRRYWGLAAALPLAIPSFVGALALLGALAPRGLLQQALEPLGVRELPEIYGYWGALVALTLSTYPYVFLLVAAGLRSMDPSAEEAARGLGAGRLAVLARVTFPALRPSLVAASILVALYVLSDFGAVSLMGYPTLTTGIYTRYESLLALEAAALLALLLVALACGVVALSSAFRLRGAAYRSTPGSGRPARIVELGGWRWPAVGFSASIVALFLALPLGVLIWWTVRADGIAGRGTVAWEAALRSTGAGAVTALAAGVVVLPAAVLAWRYPSRVSRLLERVTLFPSALPGIAVGLAFVFFGARLGGLLYQTLGLLLLAYVVRFMPYALASTRAALDSVNPRLEEAARSLGRSPLRAMAAVVLPLARPGLLAGAALVFLGTIKELPATLMLRPIGFETLATEIWQETSLASYSGAAPSALVLVAIALPVVYALSLRNAWEHGAAE